MSRRGPERSRRLSPSDVNVLATVPESITPQQLEQLAGQLTLPNTGRVPVEFARFAERGIEAADGATLSTIAAQNGIELDALVRLNPGLASKPIDGGTPVVLSRGIQPAQIALLSPAVPDTLILRNLPT
jgi:hypothetical protein